MKTHIFLVDDDHDDMTFFCEALKSVPGSYKCTYVDSPEQGIKILRYITPDYIIADYNMPTMNGLEFFSEIHNEARLHDVPFFLCSSMVTREIQQKATELGVTGCIHKPDSINSMIQLLYKILSPKMWYYKS
jgi:CheY-like chemotaxis protein